jgi:hypothetical protein
MRTKQIATGALAAGLVFAGAVLPTFSAVESFTETYGSSSAPVAIGGADFPFLISLPQFDSALGTLTDIELSVATTGSLQAVVANVGAEASFTEAAESGTITVSGPYSATASVVLGTTPFSGSIASGNSLSPTYAIGPAASGSGTGVVHVPSSDFADFTASGSGGHLDYSLNAEVDGTASGNGPVQLSFAGQGSAYGSVEVDYTYVSAVPEPADLLLTSLLGWFGLAGWNRLRRAMATKPRPGGTKS